MLFNNQETNVKSQEATNVFTDSGTVTCDIERLFTKKRGRGFKGSRQQFRASNAGSEKIQET